MLLISYYLSISLTLAAYLMQFLLYRSSLTESLIAMAPSSSKLDLVELNGAKTTDFVVEFLNKESCAVSSMCSVNRLFEVSSGFAPGAPPLALFLLYLLASL